MTELQKDSSIPIDGIHSAPVAPIDIKKGDTLRMTVAGGEPQKILSIERDGEVIWRESEDA